MRLKAWGNRKDKKEIGRKERKEERRSEVENEASEQKGKDDLTCVLACFHCLLLHHTTTTTTTEYHLLSTARHLPPYLCPAW